MSAVRSSSARSRCGADRFSPSSCFEAFAQPEIRRLEELRLVAIAERIDADLELGRHGDVIGELEGLVAEHPLRESFLRQLMVALYRAGRQAEALDVYQAARTRFVDELGIEPGPELRQLQAEILRHEAGIGVPTTTAATDEDVEIVNAIVAGRVVPVIGLDGAGDLAARLASAFGVPDDRLIDLARLSQYVATMSGSGPLYDELHSHFEAAVEPSPLHRFLARLPELLRDRGAPHQLIVTTNYDLALERAFEEAGEELDIVAYVATGPHRGRFWHRPPDEPPRPIDVPNTYATELSLERRTILLKLHGAVDPLPEREWESFVITEDDYIDYLGRSELDCGRSGRARRKAPSEPLPLPRLRDGRLEPPLDPQPHLGRPAGRLSLVGRPARAERARAGVLAAVRRDRASTSTRTSYVELLERRLETA